MQRSCGVLTGNRSGALCYTAQQGRSKFILGGGVYGAEKHQILVFLL